MLEAKKRSGTAMLVKHNKLGADVLYKPFILLFQSLLHFETSLPSTYHIDKIHNPLLNLKRQMFLHTAWTSCLQAGNGSQPEEISAPLNAIMCMP